MLVARRVGTGLAALLAGCAAVIATPTSASAVVLDAVHGQTIVIDPGHNSGNYYHPAQINQQVDALTEWKACDTTGTATAAGYRESAYTFDLALRLAHVLQAHGAHVVLTRTTDAATSWGPCITERAAIGNRAHAALAISLHADGAPAGVRGFHVIQPAAISYNAAMVPAAHRFAVVLRDTFKALAYEPYADYGSAGMRAGLDTRSDLGGLNLSKVPKVFIETGNMRNAGDAARMTSPRFRQRYADAIAMAMARYFLGATR